MKSSGAFPRSIVCVASYLLGVTTVAVLCCDDVLLPELNGRPSASPASSAMDGGEEQAPMSDLAFVFPEDIEDIAGVTGSVYINGADYQLESIKLYRAEGVLVLEAQAEIGEPFVAHFYFLDRNAEVVKEYLVNVTPDRSLITFHDQEFSGDYKSPKHGLPDEIQADVGETVEISLEKEQRLWVGGKFVNLWRVVHLPAGSSASTQNCDLVEALDHPSKVVGIISDGTSGDTVSLEVLP